MPFVTSKDGTAIAYERTGSGPPLVIVDGALCSRAFGPGAAQAARLAPHFAVYTYDRRGRGESTDTQPYAVEREIEDLAAVIEAAGGSAIVYGISVGSVLALHAAAALGATTVSRLVLNEPPFSVGDAAQEQLAQERQHIVGLVTRGQYDEAVFTFLSDIMPPDMLNEWRASADWAVLEATAPTLAYDYTVLGDGGVPVAVARQVAVPVLLLVGGESATYKHTAVEAMAKVLPHIEHVTTLMAPGL
ncbi:MAG: alpha/beta hydrolase [Chloroflexaceae bacterium]|nr:alpha/beta hydrolase [Chloroflexaceae bacterium]